MSNKLTKIGKSTLSLILCLTMLLTTFCFFDIGSVISSAMVSKSSHALTEAGTSSSTFAQYSISAPELVYIKAGGKDSEIFLNAASNGTISEPTSATSTLSFSCATARSVAISIVLLDSNLADVKTDINRVTNVAFSDGTYMSLDKPLEASSSSVNKTIKSLTMANAEPGKEYIIRWNIVYTTASGSYTTYAYTGVKFPLLSQAGMTTRQYYYGTSGSIANNPAESSTYSFITGVDSVKGGNVGSKWITTDSKLTAPLINFNASLYPRGLDMPVNKDYFDPDGTGVLLGYSKRGDDNTFGQASRVYNTQWDKPGDKTYNPKTMIDKSGYFGGFPTTDGDEWGYSAADITIDISRYTDFNQIPNLRAGFVEFDSDGGSDENFLNAIRNSSYTTYDASKYFRKNRTTNNSAGSQNTAPTIYCPDVDRGDEKNDRSWVRGLYKLSGNITTAKNTLKTSTTGSTPTPLNIASFNNNVYTTYIAFEYSLRFNPWFGRDEYCSGISRVRLNATLADKSTARKYYYQFLNSGVNTSASNWSTIDGYVKSYVMSLCVSSAPAADSYNDPTNVITTAQTYLKGEMKTTTPLSAPVYFYVPEAIYLAPRSSSWGAYTTSTFRYFVQNTINTSNRDASPTVKTGYDTTGYVYFSYANLSGDVTLTTRLWNSAMSSTLSGGSISSLSMSDDGQYKKATISSSSTSPSLSNTTTGYYIEWTASYKDAYDGHNKTITAYTYVYKPYVVPYGGSISAQNDRGTNTEAAQITWITGVHSISKEGDRYARYTTSNYHHGLLPFLSDSMEKINGGSYDGMNLNFSAYSDQNSYSERNSQATEKYSAFANTTSAQSYFFANQTNQTWNNWNPDNWYAKKNATTSVSTSSTFDKATFSYSRHDNDNGSSGDRGRSTTQTAAAEGTLYIDTSRYTNLSQIPNLGVGIMVTRDDNSQTSAWYMADYTGRTNTLGENDRKLEGENPPKVIENWNDHGTIMVRYGTPYDRKTDGEGVKYNGTWVSNVSAKSSGDKKYAVRGTYYNYDSRDTIICSVMVNMNAKLIDKTDLRAVVRRAQNNFANFGVYNNSYSSRYYQNTGAYSSFISNYKAACAALTKVDGTYGTYTDQTKINALVTALGNNIDALVKEGNTVLKRSCPVHEYNLGLEKLSNGQYKIVEIDGGKQYEDMTYDARDNVYFTPDTYEGYTFAGKYELTSFTNSVEDEDVSITPSSYYGKTLASLPTFFSASNLNSNTMSYSGSTATIGTTTTKTTTVPKFDGKNTTYEWVAAVNDTSLTMVNFYFIDQKVVTFDVNYDSNKPNLLGAYTRASNGGFTAVTSNTVNGLTTTYDRTTGTIKLNGTVKSGTVVFASLLPDDFAAGAYNFSFRYQSGSVSGVGTSFVAGNPDGNVNSYVALCAELIGENGSTTSPRTFAQTYGGTKSENKTLNVSEAQAQEAKAIQYRIAFCPVSGGSLTSVTFTNYTFKLEVTENTTTGFVPNSLVQFYGHNLGTMPVLVRENYRFLGWFTAPDGGERITASSVMGSKDMTVYAHWAITDKVLLLDNEFNFDEFVSKASTAEATLKGFADSHVARSEGTINGGTDLGTAKYYTYSIAQDDVGDTSLNIKYDRSVSSSTGVAFDIFKSSIFTASAQGDYTLTYEYRINDYYSQAYEEKGTKDCDSVVIGFATASDYWGGYGVGQSFTENKKTSDGYERVELKREFSTGNQFFFNMLFYFCNRDADIGVTANHFRADVDIKNIVIKDPSGNIVLSSNSMSTYKGSSSFDPDERTMTFNANENDCFTQTYSNKNMYMMKLETGKKYTFMMDYNASTNTRIQMFAFNYTTDQVSDYDSSTNKAAYIDVPKGSGTVAYQFELPSGRPYVQVRFGTCNYQGGSTVPGPVTFGNISIQRTEIYDAELGGYNSDSSTYLGWMTGVDGTNGHVENLTSRNEKITAHYQNIDYGAKYDELYVPTREGYTFLGWYDASGTQYADANGKAVGNHICTTDGLKLYSRWTPKTFELKYNAFRPKDSKGTVTDGTVGSLPSPNPQTLKFGIASSISATVPTLTGYTFSGWSKTSGGTKAYDKGQTLDASTVSQMYKDCGGETYNIYTVWTPHRFNVIFDGNGKTSGTMENQQFTYDVYQKLTKNTYVNTRTLTYNKNDSTASPATIDRTKDTKDLTFKGWTATAEGVATSEPTVRYSDEQEIKNPNGYSGENSTTLYAKWQGVAVTLPTPTRTGYVFAGWYDAANGGNKIGNDDSSYIITGDKTIYAHWTAIEYIVRFNANTGSGKMDDQKFAYDETKELTANSFTKTGYSFKNWTTNPNGTGTSYNDKQQVKNLANKNGAVVNLYAQWTAKTYTVTFNANSGKINLDNKGTLTDSQQYTDFKYDATTHNNVKNLYPQRTGYTFSGWFNAATGGTKVYNADGSYNSEASGFWTSSGAWKYDNNVTLYAQWTAIEYTIRFDPNNGGAETKITYTIATSKDKKTPSLPTKANHTFIGWVVESVTGENNWKVGTLYNVETPIGPEKFGNVVVKAQWLETATTNKKYDGRTEYDKTVEVVRGLQITAVSSNGEVSGNKLLDTAQSLYDPAQSKAYKEICNEYKRAYDNVVNAIANKTLTKDLINKLTTARDALSKAAAPSGYTAIKKYIDGTEKFEISYASGVTGKVPAGKYTVSDMNLNHYEYGNLKNIVSDINSAKSLSAASTQSTINDKLIDIIKNFADKKQVKSDGPAYKVYENADKAKISEVKDLAGATAVNYVYAGKGNYTYYCYTSSKNPEVLITVDETSSRVCYPTKATNISAVSSSSDTKATYDSKLTVSASNIDRSYATYIDSGIGLNSMSKENAISYYKQKAVIKLNPVFGKDKDTVTYEFKATDDALTPNVAKRAALSSGINDAANTYSENLKNNENKITIVISYHSGEQMKVSAGQVDVDAYLNQYHLLRYAGGATNWELPYSGDTVYTVNDGTYGQRDYGSFTYTFVVGSTTDLKAGKMKDANLSTVIDEFKKTDPATTKSFVGANVGGEGLGYIRWGTKNSTNWSFNYYPKTQDAYTYVHIVDRWGNVFDEVFKLPKFDYDKSSAKGKANTLGAYDIIESGGSGIAALTLNATGFEILTDENSVMENNVFRTNGNTIRIKTGEANKSYTLNMKDKATNASTATVTSDENGIITLSITDEEYKSGVYTFKLNDTEINLYDKVNNHKYILEVQNAEVEEGETAELVVITTGEVIKARITDAYGNTKTINNYKQNDDGTRTWTFAKNLSAGEYDYDVTVKVGTYTWADGSVAGKIKVNARILDSGRIISAEYDPTTNLYKVKVEGRGTKVQFITPDGMTRTYTRHNVTVKSITSYDADGEETNDTSVTLDYEVWMIDAKLASKLKYKVAGKFEAGWNRADDAVTYVVAN